MQQGSGDDHALGATDLLETLVGIPTVSSASNLDLVAFVEQYLLTHGVASTLFHSKCGKKAGLSATVGPNV